MGGEGFGRCIEERGLNNCHGGLGFRLAKYVENGSCHFPSPSPAHKGRNFTGRKTAPVISEIGDSLRFPLLRPPDPSAKIKETRPSNFSTQRPRSL